MKAALGHLAQLVDGGLLAVVAQGRHRYFRIASPAVARMIEGMMGVAGVAEAARKARHVRSGPAHPGLRRARRCYDHLAGEVAVRVADFLAASGYLEWNEKTASMTGAGMDFLDGIGIGDPVPALGRDGDAGGRSVCRPCMDWSERRPHLAGAVGRSLFQLLLRRDWVRHTPHSREIAITPIGASALAKHFRIGTCG